MKKRIHWSQTEKGKKRLEEIKRKREEVHNKRVVKEQTFAAIAEAHSGISLDDAIEAVKKELAVNHQLLIDLQALKARLK